MTKSPHVSVVIATYNRARLLGETIASVLNQSYQNFELIVVDDGSTDETRKLLERYGAQIRYFYQENRGPAAARNLGVRQALAPWIAIQDSDDVSALDHLETLHAYVKDHPECGMVFANGAYLGGSAHNRDTIIPVSKSRRLASRGVRLVDLFEKSVARLQAALISKAAYQSAGGMDESLRICHDLDLFFRLFMNYPVAYIDRVVFYYRRHEGNITRNEDLRLTENIRVIEGLMKNYPAATKALGRRRVAARIAYRYYRLAKGRWRREERNGAREAIAKAVSLSPLSLKYRLYQLHWQSNA